jgi:hypothetical protein
VLAALVLAYREGRALAAWLMLSSTEQHAHAFTLLGEQWHRSWIARRVIRSQLETTAVGDYRSVIEGLVNAGPAARPDLEAALRDGTLMERYVALWALDGHRVPLGELAPLYLDVLPDFSAFWKTPDQPHGNPVLTSTEWMLLSFRKPEALQVALRALEEPNSRRKQTAAQVIQYLCWKTRGWLSGAHQHRAKPGAQPPPGMARLEWFRQLTRNDKSGDRCLLPGSEDTYSLDGDRVLCRRHTGAQDGDPFLR